MERNYIDKFKSSRQIRMLEHKLLALIKINLFILKTKL